MSSDGSTPAPLPPPMPDHAVSGVPGARPPNYLVWAVLTAIFSLVLTISLGIILTWPFAIASIVFSLQVNPKWARGDAVGSRVVSLRAKKFAIAAFIVGVTVGGLDIPPMFS